VIEYTLEQLRDVIQLQSLKAIYCEAVDSCVKDGALAAARLKDVFTDDATGDYGAEVLQGRDAIVVFLVHTLSSGSDSIWHAIHSPRIEIDGDTGVGRWTIMARKRAKGSTDIETIIGRYVDDFRRTADGWRISCVRFRREA
jgi:SnoaL-like domain